ncbi:MAG TPA: ribosomal-processing cysteine protease Prp [Candidatus Tumulicola sp.]
MLEVSFVRDDRGRLAAVRALGHADYDQAGDDVVCAAVSAILQAARLGLERHVKVRLEATQESGVLDMAWPPEARDDASVVAIVRTAELAVSEIADQYPEHVRIAASGATRQPYRGK